MIYPDGTILQIYNVSAGRVVQLPCFMDQQEPPDGFRAIVFSQPFINTDGSIPINQNGPAFQAGSPAAIQFDLTQSMQGNQLSRIRSIAVQTVVNFNTGGSGGNSAPLDLQLDSGFAIPAGPAALNASEAMLYADFISANPIFGLIASADFTSANNASFVVTVANFKLTMGLYNGGAFNNAA